MTDYRDSTLTLLVGDARERLRDLPDGSVQTVVTSPPYFGLRDYGVAGQIGLEKSLDAYIEALVDTFREVRRVLRDDGTVWLNLGDSYASNPASNGKRKPRPGIDRNAGAHQRTPNLGWRRPDGIKPKDLIGVPWRVAFALQADGWYLRSDIIWAKLNPMPESVTDRPTRSHEFVFLLTKRPRYYYDAEAVKQPASGTVGGRNRAVAQGGRARRNAAPTRSAREGTAIDTWADNGFRNRRDVWHIVTRPYAGAHFATFPPDLVEPCVLAGTSERGQCPECGAPWVRQTERFGGKSVAGPKSQAKRDQGLATAFSGYDDGSTAPTVITLGWAPSCDHDVVPVPQTVLDPFGGAGTTALVAEKHGRRSVLVELNPDYADLALKRLGRDREGLALAA